MPNRFAFTSSELRLLCSLLTTVTLCLAAIAPVQAAQDQSNLQTLINAGDKTLQFDWPILHVGTGEYPAGPTGVTVFHFQRKVLAAVDVRGGGPGTVNAEYLQIGYDYPELDTVVFAGGSWYGLETVTAVASALKDDGIRDGDAFSLNPNIALSVGSIIFDFGPRRLNEIYPDKRLAQAAFRAARPGIFPLGPQGAGRFVKSGGFIGCNAHSGQGGAFRQIGDLKVAAFVVVNAMGVVTRRDGRIAACFPHEQWPENIRATDLLANFPANRDAGWANSLGNDKGKNQNTTISLIVTNQALTHVDLQRLATQVHTSMARALQPFATVFDGDVLYAVSTAELDTKQSVDSPDLGVIASEVMWDAILSSVPEQPAAATPAAKPLLSANELQEYVGDYVFSPMVTVQITRKGNQLFAQATGKREAYAISMESPVNILPVSETDFMIPGRYPLLLRFDKSGQLIINPGHWKQVGAKSK